MTERSQEQDDGVSEAMIEAGMDVLLGVINGNGSPPDKCVADIYLKMRQLDPALADNERLRTRLEYMRDLPLSTAATRYQQLACAALSKHGTRKDGMSEPADALSSLHCQRDRLARALRSLFEVCKKHDPDDWGGEPAMCEAADALAALSRSERKSG